FALILIAAHVVQTAIVWILGKRSAHWSPVLRRVFQQTEKVGRFAIIMLAAAIALPIIPMPTSTNDTIRKVFAACFVVLIGWIVMIASNIAIDRYIGHFNLDAADNLLARRAVTQARVFKRALNVVLFVLTAAFALMTFDSVRQFGVSLFASAGVAGIVVGLAAQPLLGNLLAGIQLAMTQPIRLDDALFIENEFGFVEEITSAFVVVRLWDWRRMIIPLTYFFQKPFQNWTRSGAALLGNAKIYVDYSIPVDRVRDKLSEIVKGSKLWDGNIVNLQVTDAKEQTIELRALFSARDSGASSDLASLVREELIAFVQKEYPNSLPRRRNENTVISAAADRPRPREVASR
ncbi:MAG TPA: mechanosensitive ion channel domain-containing protein, partial [Rhizomicrobium sp.]